MAANIHPIHTLVPRADTKFFNTANTARDGTGTIDTLATAGANGSLFDLIRIVATGTTTAGVVRIWIHNGVSALLYKEILVTAIIPSTTVEVFNSELIPSVPLPLPAGYSIRVSTHNAEGFNAHASGGDF